MSQPRLIQRHPSAQRSPDSVPPRRVHPAKRPLLDAGRDFLSDCLARNLSPRTIEQYEWSIRSFATRQPEPVLADLTAANVRAWTIALTSTRGASSVRSAVRALKVFAAWLGREGYVSVDPLARMRLPNAPDPLIVPLSGAQVARLIKTSPPLLRAAIALLVDSGIRSGELCGLRVEDVREGFVRVLGKGGIERLAPYGEVARAEVTRYVERVRPLVRHFDEYLFLVRHGAPLTSHHLGALMRRAGERAGIHGVRVSPHTLRHTFAIEFLRNGGGELALQRALGHKSLEMVRVYARLTDVDLANAHALASPLDRWRRVGSQPIAVPVRSSRRSSGDSRV